MELTDIVDDLSRTSAKIGLTINKSKTNSLLNISHLEEIRIGGEAIKKITEYKYLGRIVYFMDKSEQELKIIRANG